MMSYATVNRKDGNNVDTATGDDETISKSFEDKLEKASHLSLSQKQNINKASDINMFCR